MVFVRLRLSGTALGVGGPLLECVSFSLPPCPNNLPRETAASRSAADRIRADSSGDTLRARAPIDRCPKDDDVAGSREDDDDDEVVAVAVVDDDDEEEEPPTRSGRF